MLGKGYLRIRCLAAVAASLSLAPTGAAQVGPRCFIDPTGPRICLTSDGKLHATEYLWEGVNRLTTAGDLFVFPDAARVLACGQDAFGHGVVEEWTDFGSTYELSGVVTLPGVELAGVAFNSGVGQLFLLDATFDRILQAPWDGSSPLPTAFSPWATAADLPALADSHWFALDLPPSSAPPGHLFVCSYPQDGDWSGWVVSGTPPTLTFTTWWPTKGSPRAVHFSVDSVSMSEGGMSCTVRGPANTPFEIVDAASMQVFGTGLIPSGLESVVVELSSPLVIGQAYAARVGGEVQLSSRTTCVRRYGFPETFADGTRIHRMYRSLNGRVGTDDFAFRITLASGSPLTTMPPPVRRISGVLAIAARDGSGNDPVTTYQGNALLNTSVFVSALCFVPEGGTGPLFARVPIADDPHLEGSVLLGQFWLEDGSATRRSEVFGFDIDPAQGSGASAFPSGETATAGSARWTPAQRMLEGLCSSGVAIRDPTLLSKTFPGAGK